MIIGIDLGTTNSLVSIWKDGETHVISNVLGDSMTPSVVSLDNNGEILVGLAARDRLLTHPRLTTACFKRYMGSEHIVQLGKQKFRPEELSALLIKSLKKDAEAYLGEVVTEAVITVPAYFNDIQRKSTRTAGQLAGLKVERLLNEPTAAALAFGIHQTHLEKKILIFDLGGGTFDISILEMFEGIMEIRASAGDNFLGGEDFTEALSQAFIHHHQLSTQDLSANTIAAIHSAAEKSKRQLSDGNDSLMQIRHNNQNYSWNISTDQFAQLSEPLLKRLMKPVERALRDSKIKAQEIDEIILVGGATRMKVLRRTTARMFGRLPLAHINPDEIVSLGAAVQAGLKARDSALDEIVMTDVCPYTLGIETSKEFGQQQYKSGYFTPVLERNTVIPASRSEIVRTISDNQTEVRFNVFQGESRLVKDNIRLGDFSIKVPKASAGNEEVDVRFTYDINGLLEVEATVLNTQKKKNIIIEQSPGSLSSHDIKKSLKKLSKLKIHPREDLKNKSIITRAERLYEEFLSEDREFINQRISQFELALNTQDQIVIRDAFSVLENTLNEIEENPYL